MTVTYTSRYGKIIKRSPGVHEYWYRGKLVARGSSLSQPNPLTKPTSADWEYCVSLRSGNAAAPRKQQAANRILRAAKGN